MRRTVTCNCSIDHIIDSIILRSNNIIPFKKNHYYLSSDSSGLPLVADEYIDFSVFTIAEFSLYVTYTKVKCMRSEKIYMYNEMSLPVIEISFENNQ